MVFREWSVPLLVYGWQGRFHFPDKKVHENVMSSNLDPLRCVNDDNTITQEYPFNTLAVMPHPERVFTAWQWPWMPEEWSSYKVEHWLKMFQNARAFCDINSSIGNIIGYQLYYFMKVL
jgi:phosphoribosylformylglycinamidine synthase